MNLSRISVLIVLVIELFHFGADGEKVCSCYIFENGKSDSFTWPQAKDSCKYNNKHLVVLETEREWEFIKKEIQTRTTFQYINEWYIGLYRNLTTGNWTWINGKPLTIDKWQTGKPTDRDSYTLIAKEYPTGHKGSFNSIPGSILNRGRICEEETDNCQGVCFFHKMVPTNSTPPQTTTVTSTTQMRTSTANHHTNVPVFIADSTTTTTVPGVSGKKGDDENSSTIVIIAASLAAVLFVVLIVLAVLLFLYLRRRKRRQKDAESPQRNASNQQTQLAENQYDSINPVEAAKLLGTPDRSKDRHDDKRKNEDESPAVNCEYAVVNKADKKADKKRKAGDLVYAQLAGFDDENNDAKPQKPPSYEPTVYADVVPPELFSNMDPDSTQPTYANVQTTGV